MTIPIKIQCGCGQRYAFDVEATSGRMPYPVACPSCAADGTATANALIMQSLPAEPALTLASAGAMKLRSVAVSAPAEHADASLSVPSPASRANKRLPGQLERPQAEHEARAKILWGDEPQDVIKFLMMHGFGHEEASCLVQAMFLERAATIRSNGVRKIFTGCGLMCVPVIAALIFLGVGFFPLKIFAVTVMVGVWGAWMVIKGTIMMLAPKSEPGDVSEH
jgi:hypothetical protein